MRIAFQEILLDFFYKPFLPLPRAGSNGIHWGKGFIDWPSEDAAIIDREDRSSGWWYHALIRELLTVKHNLASAGQSRIKIEYPSYLVWQKLGLDTVAPFGPARSSLPVRAKRGYSLSSNNCGIITCIIVIVIIVALTPNGLICYESIFYSDN